MNGPLAGEMVTDVRFAGISQGAGAKSNFLVRRLQKLPFVFNIRIKAPFRGLLDSAQTFYDPQPADPAQPAGVAGGAEQARRAAFAAGGDNPTHSAPRKRDDAMNRNRIDDDAKDHDFKPG